MVVPIKYEVDPNKRLQTSIDEAIKEIGDLTIPYKLMARQWFKGNLSIFDPGRAGPGKYVDLSPKYKKAKQKNLGFVYPILLASGRLRDSVTNPTDKYAVNYIVNRKYLFLGSSAVTKKNAPYAIYMQKGSTKRNYPARPFVLIGAEQVADSSQNERLEAWITTINDFVIKKLEKMGQVKK